MHWERGQSVDHVRGVQILRGGACNCSFYFSMENFLPELKDFVPTFENLFKILMKARFFKVLFIYCRFWAVVYVNEALQVLFYFSREGRHGS